VDDSQYPDVVWASEFGWVGMPSLETLQSYLPNATTDYTLLSPRVSQKGDTASGLASIYTSLENAYGPYAWGVQDASTKESFRRAIHLSQVQQSACMRAETEHYRRGRDDPKSAPHTMGSTYWMLDSAWPAADWASLEWGGRWKLLHYEMQKVYSPIVVSSYCTPSPQVCRGIEIYIGSERPEQIDAVLTLSVVSFLDGSEIDVAVHTIQLAPRGGLLLHDYNNSVTTTGGKNLGTVDLVSRSGGCAFLGDCFIRLRLEENNATKKGSKDDGAQRATQGEHDGKRGGVKGLAPDNMRWIVPWRDARLGEATFTVNVLSHGVSRGGANTGHDMGHGGVGGGGGGGVNIMVNTTFLEIRSDHVSPLTSVYCSDPNDHGHFSDNGFWLVPGKPIQITYYHHPKKVTGQKKARKKTGKKTGGGAGGGTGGVEADEEEGDVRSSDFYVVGINSYYEVPSPTVTTTSTTSSP